MCGAVHLLVLLWYMLMYVQRTYAIRIEYSTYILTYTIQPQAKIHNVGTILSIIHIVGIYIRHIRHEENPLFKMRVKRVGLT